MAELPCVKLEDRPRAAPAAGEPVVDPAPVVGTWIAADRDSAGVVRLELAAGAGGGLLVRAWGAGDAAGDGEPGGAPRDWGEVSAELYTASVDGGPAAGFTARYDFGFLETLLTAYFKGGLLVLDTFNRFRDDSGRAPYFTREFYHR